MQPEVHFAKGERFEQAQAKLAPATDWELAIEGCYYAAFQFILAGTSWRGVRHSDNHPHAEAVKLLTQAGAPSEALTAWSALETVRAGRVYGKQSDSGETERSRERVKQIKGWALLGHP
ncbi:MAG TPA: hypothetical protein VFS83_14520 [Ktedonobacterales bacterium]|nr:hypothetical protein [Ktedonobacterales bacterium]